MKARIMFSVGMACAAIEQVLASGTAAMWLPESAVISGEVEDGKVTCHIPCAAESDIDSVEITLAMHRGRWFPVTVEMTERTAYDHKGFIFKNACSDGSIVELVPFDPHNDTLDRFDLGQSMVCPHPPASYAE